MPALTAFRFLPLSGLRGFSGEKKEKMFSGIVEERASVVSLLPVSQGARLGIESSLDLKDSRTGDSFAIDGVCLTLSEAKGSRLFFDIGSETLRRTTLGVLKSGNSVNLERSLKLGERIHGHLVSGHVDGVARLVGREDQGQTVKLIWNFPSDIGRYLAPKGAVALAGISLTIGEVAEESFSVYIIPHTLEVTGLRGATVGAQANIEVDLLARYVCRVLSVPVGAQARDAAWQELLERAGFASNARE